MLTGDKMIIHVMDEGKGFRLRDVPDPLAEEGFLSTSEGADISDASVHG